MKKRFLKALAVAMLPVALTGTLASCGNLNSNNTVDVSESQKENDGSDEKNDIEKVVLSIEKTSSDGLDDIYTITFTDGTTTTFKITNEKPENPNDPVLSAYETYKKNHPEYEGSEEDWINDLIEGNLSSKIMISFDTNNGSNINPIIISAGSSLNSIEIPTREGFKFEGWKINDEIIDINSYKFNESATLQAVWTDIRVNVDSLYLLETNDVYTVLGVDDNHPSNITIPSTYDNKNIISISSDAFKNINDIKSIKFGKNIQKIDSNAFKGCNALENVFFEGTNDEWNNITNNALEELANVDICFYSEENPTIDGNYWHYDEGEETPIIWNELRYGLVNNEYVVLGIGECKNKDIVIPRMYKGKKVTGIGAMAFYNCTNLETIELPDTIKSIETAAFLQCTNLKSIKIPEGLTSIKAEAFDDCSSLTNMELPTSVTYIEGTILRGCASLTSITLPIIELDNQLGGYMTTLFGWVSPQNLSEVIINKATTITSGAFENICTEMKRIVLPDNVVSIDDCAFRRCYSLESINIPTSVTSIGEHVFSYCRSLTSIEIPANVESIGEGAFSECVALTVIKVDENNTKYNSKNNCNAIIETEEKKLIAGCCNTILPDDIKIIGNYAFASLDIESIVLPNSVTYIGDYAFYNCQNLRNIGISNNLISIGEHAFGLCYKLNKIEIPNGVINIGKEAFSGCYNLRNIEIPDSVTSIGERAFDSCKNLRNIKLPFIGDKLENPTSTMFSYVFYDDYIKNVIITKAITIGENAFKRIQNLESIVLPNTVKKIEKSSFEDCYLNTICYNGSKNEFDSVQIDNDSGLDYNKISYYSKEEPLDLSESYWHYDEDGITPILWQNGLKYETTFDDEIRITGIGDYKNTDIIIPETYKSKKVTYIGPNAFLNCTNLTSIQLPDSIIGIERSAFSGCSNLTSIKIPDSLSYIGESVFLNCNSLQYNEYDNAKYLGNENNPYLILVKAKSKDIVTCVIDEKCKFIYTSAFWNCNSLTEIEIPSNVISRVMSYAFQGCSNLTSIEIPDSVTSIGEYAFSGCSGLTSVTIGNSVTSIGFDAFDICTSLIRVYYKGTKEQWDEISINSWGNYNLTSVTRYYYSETEPTDGDNLYWHYDDDGITPVLWLCQLENGLEYINVDGGYKIMGIGSCKDNDIIVPETYNGKNIISIGTNAFSNCTNLTSIKLPDSIIEIEKGAFSGCYNLINITIPFIGETLEKSTNETMNYFFGGTYWGLKKITITKALSIGARAFDGYRGLTSIEIPNSVTSIGEFAFSGCRGLTSIEIPNSVTSIGVGAFYNCSNLIKIRIPNNVLTIEDNLFEGCSELTSIEIPNSVTSIGDEAFYNCSSLTDVYYKGTKEQWDTISIVDSNDYLTSATRYYYSETQPTNTDYKYWHYVDGIPTTW